MDYENRSSVTEFILVGFSGDRQLQIFFFVTFSLIYGATVVGNSLIIGTVAANSTLRSPMYFLLGNLSLLDMGFSTVTTPKMIRDLLAEHKSISVWGCMAQMFFMHLFGGAEMTLLIVMAFDRYVAICKPLHYRTIMSHRVCYALLLALWLGGFAHSIVQVALILNLPFCGPNHLDNFFCDVPQVIKLACTDTFAVELLMVSNSGLLTLLCFLGLLASYAVILYHVKGQCSEGKRKAVSTCTTHIIIVFLMFGPAIFIYTRPFQALKADKVVSLFHTVIFPLMNPVIYTLRNQEVKTSMRKLLNQYVVC
ncbi:Olfactory receptor 4N2 [Lemmus lemmus]